MVSLERELAPQNRGVNSFQGGGCDGCGNCGDCCVSAAGTGAGARADCALGVWLCLGEGQG